MILHYIRNSFGQWKEKDLSGTMLCGWLDMFMSDARGITDLHYADGQKTADYLSFKYIMIVSCAVLLRSGRCIMDSVNAIVGIWLSKELEEV